MWARAVTRQSARTESRPIITTRLTHHGDSDLTSGFDVRSAWRLVAILFLLTSGTVAFSLAANLTPTPLEHLNTLYLLALSGALSSGLWWVAGARRASPRLLHIPVVLAIAIITIGMFMAGPIATSLLLIYIIPLTIASLFLSIPHVAGYGATILGVILAIYLNTADGVMLATTGVFVTGTTTIAATTVMTLVRHQIDRVAAYARELSGTDPLTGLPNLRRLYQRLDVEIARAERTRSPITLVMIDLDDFKSVNDLHSHSHGDAILRAVANAITRIARRDELVARRGGDEFAVLTNSQSEQQSTLLVDRIHAAVVEARHSLCPDIMPTASIGMAIHAPGESSADLVARADRALHAKKQRSRRGYGARRGTDDLGEAANV